jgi:hypothetical protein
VHEAGQIPDAKTLAIYDVLVCRSGGVDRAAAAILKSAYWSDAARHNIAEAAGDRVV